MRPIDAWYMAQQIEKMYWGATAATFGSGLTRLALTGNPATLRFAGKMASLGARAHLNSVRAVLSTPLVRGGTVTVGAAAAKAASAVGLGYAAGATLGTAVSGLAFGKEGAQKAIDLYTSPTKFVEEGIVGMPKNIYRIGEHYLTNIF